MAGNRPTHEIVPVTKDKPRRYGDAVLSAWPLGDDALSWRLNKGWVLVNEETGQRIDGSEHFLNGREIDWHRRSELREARKHGDTGVDDGDIVPF